ncbi:MAG: DNA translocase FtsK [Anaerolineae bacterium]|jgi:S-DNA-T family DNA segregation ATPase FtsK/SpoIIIE|nr:DNA translocase FtsK [Anaerolineae bacterium]
MTENNGKATNSDKSNLTPINTREENTHLPFARYRWDVIGVILITIALVTLIGLFSNSQTTLLSRWVAFLRRLFGAGSFFLLVGFFALGIDALHHTIHPDRKIHLGPVLQIELMLLLVLPLLSILNGHSLPDALNGFYGGIVGWGLAELLLYVFPALILSILLIAVIIFLFLSGSGLLKAGITLLDRWSKKTLAPQEKLPGYLAALRDQDSITAPEPQSTAVSAESNRRLMTNPAPQTNTYRPGHLPPLDLLLTESSYVNDEQHIRQTALLIEQTMEEFHIPARVVGYRIGPTVTQYAVEPGFTESQRPDGSIQRKKIRISQISGLTRDLARALSAERLRIEAPVPGHSFVGIEVANPKSTVVRLRAMLSSEAFHKLKNKPLAMALGRDVSGAAVLANLAAMPHLLIAGTTGSGKSICLQALTACLIMNNSPAELRLAMLDPKMVELVRFNGLPHLLGKVETDMERMLTVLRWALVEMENRYRVLESEHTRDIEAYNRKMKRQNRAGLPYIVILIDELADLMMLAPEQTENSLTRLAQKARATGIHLIVATQRPSTDVVTGMIKANFPARIAFQVATGVDSRVVLDTNGAEDLLGNGDMLFVDPSVRAPVRAQGVLISDGEIENVIDYWQQVYEQVDRKPEEIEAPWEDMVQPDGDGADELFEEVVRFVIKTGRANASLIQRQFHIGYPRAASIIDQMEANEIIGPSLGGGRDREIFISSYEEFSDDSKAGAMQDGHTVTPEESRQHDHTNEE